MPAPQQFAPGLFYVAPPDAGPNAFASFWSNFLQARAPYAQAVFQARLRAMDTSAQDQAVAQLAQQLAGLRKAEEQARDAFNSQVVQLGRNANEARLNDLKALQMEVDIYKSDNMLEAQRIASASNVSTAQLRVQGDLIEAGVPSTEKAKLVKAKLQQGMMGVISEHRAGRISDEEAAEWIDRHVSAANDQLAGEPTLERLNIFDSVKQQVAVTAANDTVRSAAIAALGQGSPHTPLQAQQVGVRPSALRDDIIRRAREAGPSGSVSVGGSVRGTVPVQPGAAQPGTAPPPSATTTPPVTSGGAPAAGVLAPDTEGLRRAGDRIDELIDDIRNRKPNEDLGALWDPIPAPGLAYRRKAAGRPTKGGKPVDRPPPVAPAPAPAPAGQQPQRRAHSLVPALLQRVVNTIPVEKAKRDRKAGRAEEQAARLAAASMQTLEELEERERRRREQRDAR